MENKKNEEWKKARAMIKAGLTILTTNYEEEWGVGCVCEELREVLKVMDSWKKKKDGEN